MGLSWSAVALMWGAGVVERESASAVASAEVEWTSMHSIYFIQGTLRGTPGGVLIV